ncbi:MAG: hypothetical protein EHM83_13010, partial [Burkholderiales bacterium]
MSTCEILHQTSRRLRVSVPPDADLATLRTRLEQLPGVESVRINATLRCVAVRHTGAPETRAAVLDRLCGDTGHPPRQPGAPSSQGTLGQTVSLAPALLAASVPILPRDWRGGAALAVV